MGDSTAHWQLTPAGGVARRQQFTTHLPFRTNLDPSRVNRISAIAEVDGVHDLSKPIGGLILTLGKQILCVGSALVEVSQEDAAF